MILKAFYVAFLIFGSSAFSNGNEAIECESSTGCAVDKRCIEKTCKDPCPNACGENAICEVKEHYPICSCPPGWSGDPFRICDQIEQECSEIFKCPEDKICANGKCIDPCVGACGKNANCVVKDHHPICSCASGWTGNPLVACDIRDKCKSDDDCSTSKVCINEICRDPCASVCGVNAVCSVKNRNPICSCPPEMIGDPLIKCEAAKV